MHARNCGSTRITYRCSFFYLGRKDKVLILLLFAVQKCCVSFFFVGLVGWGMVGGGGGYVCMCVCGKGVGWVCVGGNVIYYYYTYLCNNSLPLFLVQKTSHTQR